MTKPRNHKSLCWHIKANDYFGTLATVLDLLRQKVEREGYSRQDGKLLVELREELMILQTDFSIVKRTDGEPGV
jgi:hypothetical protein